jgi:gliding motility-associated-like protein
LTPECKEIKQDFKVTVGKPAAPQDMDSVEYCQNAASTPLSGVSSPGCTLVWYSSDGTKLSSAPAPPTDVPGTFSYYASQAILNDMACESENKTEVKIIIHALPEPVLSINPVAVCAGKMPSIEIENSISGYEYRPYSSSSGITPIGDTVKGDGGNIYLPTVLELSSDTTYYVEVTSDLGCVSLSRTPVFIDVTQLYITPDKLPAYKKGTPYSEWLSSNAVQPTYRITYGDLPQGIMLSMTGEISGTAPVAGGVEHKTFVVEVEDNAGCKAEREYILNCEMTVSEIFTPNGDGVNDYFMRGYHVVIFDRLGRKIFEGDDGWDGTHKGSAVATDTYFYILYYVDDKGLDTKTSGNITLLM